MMPRRGFTLLELMVALVLTGVVALLAYGTAATGLDTRDRLETYRSTVEARMIVRALLVDALRHPPEGGGAAMGDTLFVLEDRTAADGLPVDQVAFFSRGITPPLGASGLWMVSLAPSPLGLLVRAAPVELPAGAPAPVDVLLPDVRGLDARVLDRTADQAWRNRWEVAGRWPAAISLRFFTSEGELAGPPLVVHSALEEVR